VSEGDVETTGSQVRSKAPPAVPLEVSIGLSLAITPSRLRSSLDEETKGEIGMEGLPRLLDRGNESDFTERGVRVRRDGGMREAGGSYMK
jgi:hypothetical protein